MNKGVVCYRSNTRRVFRPCFRARNARRVPPHMTRASSLRSCDGGPGAAYRGTTCPPPRGSGPDTQYTPSFGGGQLLVMTSLSIMYWMVSSLLLCISFLPLAIFGPAADAYLPAAAPVYSAPARFLKRLLYLRRMTPTGTLSDTLTFSFRGPGAGRAWSVLGLLVGLALAPRPASAQATLPPAKLEALKQELIGEIDKQQKATQQMVDMVFSFGELGFQETETSRYLTGIL